MRGKLSFLSLKHIFVYIVCFNLGKLSEIIFFPFSSSQPSPFLAMPNRPSSPDRTLMARPPWTCPFSGGTGGSHGRSYRAGGRDNKWSGPLSNRQRLRQGGTRYPPAVYSSPCQSLTTGTTFCTSTPGTITQCR